MLDRSLAASRLDRVVLWATAAAPGKSSRPGMPAVLTSRRSFALALGVASLLFSCGRPPATRQSVIVLMLDTLRADHLGFYGYERNTSPHLDAFARENIAFKHAFTAAPWTPPSVATMFTGVYPSSHGFMPPGKQKEAGLTKRLAPELRTLAEILKQHGYRTAAVSPNPWISAAFGFDRGFETFRYLYRESASRIVSVGMELVRDLSRKQEPFFLYLHFLDPHDPYTPPEGYAEMFPGRLTRAGFPYRDRLRGPMRRYDGEIRYLDDELGRFFSFLKDQGLYDQALIVVIADHGEQFGEHGAFRHGNALHNEEVHVPFFIRDPRSGRSAETVEDVVSTVDLFPTLLGQLGIAPPPTQADGLSVFYRDSLAMRAGVATEIYRIRDQRGFISREKQKGIFVVPLLPREQEGQRAELWEKPELEGLYDVQADYFEQRPLDDSLLLSRLRTELEGTFRRTAGARGARAQSPVSPLTPEMVEQLKSLGYLK